MKATLSIAFVLAAFSQLVAAGGYFPTSPVGASVWKAGSQQTIEWQNTASGPTIESTTIDLGQGAGNNVQPVMNIATAVSVTTTSYKWTVPTTLTTYGKVYAIRFTGLTADKSNPVYGYSTYFTIEAADGSLSSKTNTTTPSHSPPTATSQAITTVTPTTTDNTTSYTNATATPAAAPAPIPAPASLPSNSTAPGVSNFTGPGGKNFTSSAPSGAISSHAIGLLAPLLLLLV